MEIRKTLTNIVAPLLVATSSLLPSAHSQDYQDISLITPAEATRTYGENIPSNVYTSLDDVFAHEGDIRVGVGTGTFEGNQMYWNDDRAVIINGSGKDNTWLNTTIFSIDYLEINGVSSQGDVEYSFTTGEYRPLFAVFGKEGKLTNSYLTGNAIIGINPSFGTEISNNIFENINLEGSDYVIRDYVIDEEEEQSWDYKGWDNAIYVEDIFSPELRQDILFNRNHFENISSLIYLSQSSLGIRTFGGENVFLNCDRVINNPHNYPQEFPDNFWADSINKSNGLQVYTNPEEIRSLKISGEGKEFVNVGNPLTYNPLTHNENGIPVVPQGTPINATFLTTLILGGLGLLASKKRE